MLLWQLHQLDHMQIICTLLQTDRRASTSSFNCFHNRWSSRRPNHKN